MKPFTVATILCAILASVVKCDEPSEQFLQALRDRQYYDVALEYLDDMQTSPLASEEFKRMIPFERAQTLIQSTSRIRDLGLLEKKLQEAEALLSKSAENADTKELKARSENNKGDLLFRRAKIYLGQAENDRLTANEKNAQYTKAREYLEKSLDAFDKAKSTYKNILDNYRIDLEDNESRQKLKRLRGVYTVVRLKFPQIMELFADTLEESDSRRVNYLKAAAMQFEELWVKYPKFPAGLDSCYYTARCKYKLKEYSAALLFLERLFGLSNALLPIKRKAMSLASDCWEQTAPYPFDDVIANLEPYCKKLTKRDQRNSDWQRIQMELARAYYEKSLDLKATKPSDGRHKSFSRDASKLIKSIARMPGRHREKARQLMAQWNLKVDATTNDNPKTVIRTFSDAKQRGVDIVNQIEGLNADISDARKKLLEPGADRQTLERDIAELNSQLERLTGECISVFERAIALKDASTTKEDLNQIRYLQSVCYFVRKQFFEAALIGEFLVERNPSIAFSRQAGGIAIRSYAALHDAADDEERKFERERLTKLSKKMIDTWPGSNESAEAASTLAKLTLAKSDFSSADIEQTETLINSVGESSLEKSSLAVKLGTKLWFNYRNKKSAGQLSDSEINGLLADATSYLEKGVGGYNLGDLRMEAAWGAIFLTNAYLDARNLDQALKQLEESRISPIDLVKDRNRVVTESGKFDLYSSETYKIAGKCYLAALSKFPEDRQWTDKALGIVRAMQARANRGGNEKAKQDVLNMYRLIAVELDQQLVNIKEPEKQKRFVKNLNQFLHTLQAESKEPNTIIWAGKTMMDMADSFAAQGMEAEAKPLYVSAIAALNRASQMGVKDKKLINELKRQQAIAKRGTGKYQDAYDELLELLKENPKAWQIQIDVAKTLQVWGTSSRTTKVLAKALAGCERMIDPKSKRPKNLVWGWSKLAEILKSHPKFKEPYYTSVMGAVETRFTYGQIEQNQKIVAASLKRLQIAKSNDATLGGEKWKPKFDSLESKIKKQLESM